MSHPLADPAVSTVAAGIGGLDAVAPAKARILEIGCASGFHLVPLALRWPQAEFTGIDPAGGAIEAARGFARDAGVANIRFECVDLRDFQAAPESFDIIIAHGVFSWVPDEVKRALLAFCRRHLAPSGFATVSFNLSYGWRRRFPIIAKARAIAETGGADTTEALQALSAVAEPAELEVIDDMLAKGPAVLAFDDFAPVNDPWPLDRFVAAAEEAGLSWIGESDPGGNFPHPLDAATMADLRSRHPDPLALQCAADEAAERTFRSGILCRADAPRQPGIAPERLLGLPLRVKRPPAPDVVAEAFAAADPDLLSCLPQGELRDHCAATGPREWMTALWRGLLDGSLELRTDPVRLSGKVPEFPSLDPFRLSCARRGLPVVDVWHRPCTFPAEHRQIVAAMDGTHGLATLREMAREGSPELAFDPWIRHLAGRGFFR